MTIDRWPGSGPGRSRTVRHGDTVRTVATASDTSAGFDAQVAQCLDLLDRHLEEAGSARTHLLSVQVLLTDIGLRPAFDAQWCQWIGPDPAHWPQRACFQAALAPGLLVEITAVAATLSVGRPSAL